MKQELFGQHILFEHLKEELKIMNLDKLLSRFSGRELNKIKDYIFSEIDEDTIKETEDFIKCKLDDRKNKFENSLYEEGRYTGVFLDGNQYIISEENNLVTIIDYISEEYGVDQSFTRFYFSVENFLFLIHNSKQVLKYEKK